MKTDDVRGEDPKGGKKGQNSPENLLIIVKITSQVFSKKRGRGRGAVEILAQGRQAEGHVSYLLSWWLAGAHVATARKSFLWFTCYFVCLS